MFGVFASAELAHDGVESAITQARAAGDGNVGVSGPDIAQQCLSMGLLDEIRIDLVPVFLGEGVRYFDHISNEGEGVTHLRYDVHYR